MIKEVSTGYEPRPLQAVLHASLKRFNVVVCHRRFGKTIFSINEMIDRALRCKLHNPQFAYLAPTYSQAKRVVWTYLKDYTANIPGVEVNEAELRIDISRGKDRIRFFLLGAENPGNLRGIYLDGAILDEVAEMTPDVWTQVIRPALSDRMGWAIFIGTPKGTNHFYEILQHARANTSEWFHAIYKSSETGIIPKSELESAKQMMAENEYEQEFECSFSAALVGAYYGKEMAKMEDEARITKVPYDSAVPVFTGWDLGISDTTTIWFAQIVGKAIHLIDYEENSGSGLDYYVKILKEKGYDYEEHFLPHDAAARDLSTGKTRVQTLQSMGLRNVTVVPRLDIEDGINASRLLLNKAWVDRDKCKRGIDALKNYERKFDQKNKIFQARPLHNWASHCFTGDTLVLTKNGSRQIQYLEKEGEVLTLCGWKQYTNPRITKRNARLVEVVFEDGSSVRCTPEHKFLTVKGWRYAKYLQENTPILSSLDQAFNSFTGEYTGNGQAKDIIQRVESLSTVRHGMLLLEKFQRDTMFIIRTLTQMIIDCVTLSFYPPASTCQLHGIILRDTGVHTSLNMRDKRLPNGTHQKKEESGTVCMHLEHSAGKNGKGLLKNALCALLSLWQYREKMGIARNTAQRHVNLSTVTVKRINNLETKEDVWCLTVPGVHHFSLANGAIVHNCADGFRTLAVGLDENKPLRETLNNLPRMSDNTYDIWGT